MTVDTESITKFFASQKAKTYIYIALALVAAAAIIWIVCELTGTTAKLKDKYAQKKLDELLENEISAPAVTLNEATAKALADKLYEAMDGWGTDESAIFEVMNEMKSRSDVLMLIRTFGVRDGKNLVQWITSELNAKDRAQVNNILATNNVNYKF